MTLIYEVQTLRAKEETLSGESDKATKGRRHKSKEEQSERQIAAELSHTESVRM